MASIHCLMCRNQGTREGLMLIGSCENFMSKFSYCFGDGMIKNLHEKFVCHACERQFDYFYDLRDVVGRMENSYHYVLRLETMKMEPAREQHPVREVLFDAISDETKSVAGQHSKRSQQSKTIYHQSLVKIEETSSDEDPTFRMPGNIAGTSKRSRPYVRLREYYTKKSNEKYTCNQCGNDFKSYVYINQHIKDRHLDAGQFACDFCNREFNNKALLTLHIQCHIKEDSTFTEQSERDTAHDSQDLNDSGQGKKKNMRMREHYYKSIDGRFFCNMCNKPFMNYQNCYIHIRQVHLKCVSSSKMEASADTSASTSALPALSRRRGRKPRNPDINYLYFVDNENKYVCKCCKKPFNTFQSIYQHIRYVHLKLREYSCDYCGGEFYTKRKLKMHIDTHIAGNYECQNCHKLYASEHSLYMHEYRRRCYEN